jgi:hypothetical protein
MCQTLREKGAKGIKKNSSSKELFHWKVFLNIEKEKYLC